MKKLITFLLVVMSVTTAFSQMLCTTSFTYQASPGTVQYWFMGQNSIGDSSATSTWDWTFEGGTPATASMQNPGPIVFDSAIAHSVCLHFTSLNGCDVYYCDTVITPCNLLLTAVITPAIVNGADGYIDLTATNGVQPYTYYWSSGQTTEDISGTSNYFGVTVTDATGCSATQVYYIYQDSSQTCSANYTYQTNPGTMQYWFVGQYSSNDSTSTFTWDWTFDGGTPATASGQYPGPIVFDSANTFHAVCLQVRSSNGCVANYCDSIGSNTNPCNIVLTAAITNASSNGTPGYIDLTVSGGTQPYAYSWNTGQTTEDITGLSGFYYVAVTDANGCSVTQSFSISTDSVPQCSATITYQTNPSTNQYWFAGLAEENGGTVTASSYSWTFEGGTPATSSLQNPNPVTFDSSRFHNVCLQIVTASGCQSSDCVQIITGSTDSCNIIITANITNATVNSYGYIDLTVSGGIAPYVFQWNNGDTTEDLIAPAGWYTVAVTDANGCSVTSTFSILDDSTATSCYAYFTYNLVGSYQVYFTDNSSPASPTSSIVSWTWEFGDGTSASLQNPMHVYNADGSYTVCLSIITSDSCYNQFCQDIYIQNNPCNLTATYTVTPVSIIGGNDGAIDLTVAGGTAPYYFYWSNGASTEDVQGLSAGLYDVYISSNDTTCSLRLLINLYEPYDSTGGPIVDTLFTNPVDTCLNFTVDSFFVSNVVINNNIVTVTWVLTGQGLSSAFTVDYTFDSAGNTVVYLTISCGKVLTTYMTYIHINAITGINESLAKTEASIFPVPVTNVLNVRLDNKAETKTVFSVYNMNGDLVIRYENNLHIGENIIQLNTELLPKGVYILKTQSAKNITSNRFMK